MPKFIRLTDAAELEPLVVLGPYEVARDPRTVTRGLLQSSRTRTTYMPTGHRKGVLRALFQGHEEARDGMDFFTAWSEYELVDVRSLLTGEYAWQDGYYLPVDPGANDESFTTRFTVTDGELSIEQDEDQPRMFILTIPYRETPA